MLLGIALFLSLLGLGTLDVPARKEASSANSNITDGVSVSLNSNEYANEILEGNAYIIPKNGYKKIQEADGSTRSIPVEREFFATRLRKVEDGLSGPKYVEETFETSYVHISTNGSYKKVFDIGKREGRHVISLRLHPNVGLIPEEGTLIEIDGAYLGFRLLDQDERLYELVRLTIEGDRDFDWMPISTVCNYIRPGDEWIRDLRATMTRESGMPSFEWDSFDITITINYDDNTWWQGGANEQRPNSFPLLSGIEKPMLRVSNGPSGSTVVCYSEISSENQVQFQER